MSVTLSSATHAAAIGTVAPTVLFPLTVSTLVEHHVIAICEHAAAIGMIKPSVLLTADGGALVSVTISPPATTPPP